jgi:DNA-directed RNA polymerase subunit M/transcription elongation factor TFIIS
MRAESITALEDAIWARDCDDRLERSIRDRRYGDSVHIACTAHKTDPSLELAYQDQETIVLMELLFPDLSARSLQAEAYRLAHGAKEIESVVKCRCGGNTTVRCSQTRSADEAMTEFYRCVGGNGRAGCGRSWKV